MATPAAPGANLRRPVHRAAALLAVAALLGLLPLRSGHGVSTAEPQTTALVAASFASGAPEGGAPLHDEGSCSVCRALRDARTLAPPALPDSAAISPAAPARAAEPDPAGPRAAFRSGAAPRAPPLA